MYAANAYMKAKAKHCTIHILRKKTKVLALFNADPEVFQVQTLTKRQLKFKLCTLQFLRSKNYYVNTDKKKL